MPARLTVTKRPMRKVTVTTPSGYSAEQEFKMNVPKNQVDAEVYAAALRSGHSVDGIVVNYDPPFNA